MNAYEYATPSTLEEATGLLGSSWGETEVLAGGTDLVTCLKQGLTSPKRVVSLKNIEGLSGIENTGDKLVIGAMTTVLALSRNGDVRKHFPALATAANEIGAAQMMAIGTVGGDLCQRPRCWYFRNGHGLFATENGQDLVPAGDNRYHAIFGNSGKAKFVSASSFGPALIALGASMEAVGPGGKSRTIAAADFFNTPGSESDRETTLKPNEILTKIHVPLNGLKNATYEVRHRAGLDWPLVTASVAWNDSYANVVLGHVAPVPWQSATAADAMATATEDLESADRIAAAAAEGATPLSGNGYKVHLVKTAVRRALIAAAGV